MDDPFVSTAVLRLRALDTSQNEATPACHQGQMDGMPAPCPLCGQGSPGKSTEGKRRSAGLYPSSHLPTPGPPVG